MFCDNKTQNLKRNDRSNVNATVSTAKLTNQRKHQAPSFHWCGKYKFILRNYALYPREREAKEIMCLFLSIISFCSTALITMF